MPASDAKKSLTCTLGKALPWVWLLAAWLFGMAFMQVYGRSLLDSDMASEMVLAALLNKEGGILSTNWYYSTELRVFCEQILFKLGLYLFPQDWHAARMLAQGILSAMVAVSGLYFAYGANLRRSAPWIAGALLCPFGFWQLFHCVFGGFYYVHMIFVMVSMGLVLRLADRAGSARRTAVRVALLAGVAMAAGFNGVRILMNLYVPLLAAALVLLVWRWNQAPLRRPLQLPQVRFMLAALEAALFSTAGYAFNAKVLATNHIFSDQAQRNWTTLDLTRLLQAWSDFLTIFGYPGDRGRLEFDDPAPLFSLVGILGAVGLVTALVLVASAVHLIFRRKSLAFGHGAVLAVFLACLLVDGMVFAFMNDMNGINGSYWLPVVPLAFAVLGAEGETLPLRRGLPRRGLALGFAAAIVCTSISTTIQFVKAPPRGDPHMETICDWLVENGYTKGYATFWYANVLTELSNGQLELWTVDDMGRMNLHEWLQDVRHNEQPEGAVFFILDPSVQKDDQICREFAQVVYEDDFGFMILAAPEAGPVVEGVQAAQ